jgi:hypothetical protein
MRELTNAELDIVSGGTVAPIYRPAPSQSCGGGEVKLVEEIVADILKILEGNCATQLSRLAAAK